MNLNSALVQSFIPGLSFIRRLSEFIVIDIDSISDFIFFDKSEVVVTSNLSHLAS